MIIRMAWIKIWFDQIGDSLRLSEWLAFRYNNYLENITPWPKHSKFTSTTERCIQGGRLPLTNTFMAGPRCLEFSSIWLRLFCLHPLRKENKIGSRSGTVSSRRLWRRWRHRRGKWILLTLWIRFVSNLFLRCYFRRLRYHDGTS